MPTKAYAQPYWSAEDILPLDSGRERDQVVKPNFEGTVHAIACHRFLRSLVAETMRLGTAEYHAKKARLKQILTRKSGCYLEHVAHGDAAQAGHNVRFRKDLFAFGKLVIQADKRASVQDHPTLL